MTQFADIVVYSPNGQIVLVVESKNRLGASREWAAQLRRNIMAHGIMPDSPYFLLALPDRFYLWKNAGNTPDLVEPTYELDASPFIQSYFEAAKLSPQEIGGYAFDMIITVWLNQFIHWGLSPEAPAETQQMIEDSGLHEALKNGKVVVQVPA